MRVSLRILKKGKEYHVQRRYFGIWVSLSKGYSEHWAKRDLERWISGFESDKKSRELSKIQEVVEVRHVDV